MMKISERGITLVEIIIAAAILASVAAGISLFAPQAMQAFLKAHARSSATTLASSKVQELTSAHPYATLPITPDGPYFDPSAPKGPCDCSTVNFAYPGGLPTTGYGSSETITVGSIDYTRQTCVNYLKNVAGTWQSNCTDDKGVKQVVTNLSWNLGSNPQSLTMSSMVSPPSQYGSLIYSTGSVSVTVCAADGTLPTPGCGAGIVSGAEVAVYNASFVAENGHALPPNPVVLNVPPGYGYTLHVQLLGYFPYHQTGITVPASGNVPLTAILRDIPTYGSKVVGEAFTATHPVISKVVAQVADTNGGCTPQAPVTYCMDNTEALEIYNPTVSTYTFGAAGNLSISYYDYTAAPKTYNFSSAQFTLKTSYTISPGSYYLIVGQDTVDPGVPNPEWVAPDITYSPNDPALQFPGQSEGLIPYKRGGGIQLLVNGIVVDSIRWTGTNTDGTQAYPSAGTWDASPLPAGSIKPIICNP